MAHLLFASMQAVLTDAAQAGLSALTAATVELIRRFLTDHQA